MQVQFLMHAVLHNWYDTGIIKKVYQNRKSVLGYVPSDVNHAASNGSMLHLKIVESIQSKSLSRPKTNVDRRNFEDHKKAMYF